MVLFPFNFAILFEALFRAHLPNGLNHLGNLASPEADALGAELKLDDELGLRTCCDVVGLFSLLDVWLNLFGAC